MGSHVSDLERDEMEVSESERSLTIAEVVSSTPEKDQRDGGKSRKRKAHQAKSKTKRSRKEEESSKEMVSNCQKDDSESRSSPAPLSPNSLSAKNVIRKKGEVVISWSRSVVDSLLYHSASPRNV